MLDEAVVRQLISDLGSEDWRVVQHARNQLPTVSEPHLIEIIITALDNPRRIEIYIGSTLYLIGQPAIDPLLSALNSPNPLIRYGASHILSTYFQESRAAKPLIKLLSDSELVSRQGAIGALGWLGMLGKLGDIDAIEPLLSLLAKEEHYTTKRLIISALGNIGDKRATETLIELTHHSDKLFRLDAITGLGKIGDERAVSPLIKCLIDEYPHNQFCAVEALEKIRTPKALAAAAEWRDQHKQSTSSEN